MFGTVLDKLDAFFGRAYLLSRFFPCVVFLAVNLALVYAAFPDSRPFAQAALAAIGSTSGIIYLLLALVLLAAFAYMLGPFGRVAMQLLEGDWLLEIAGVSLLGRSMILVKAFAREQSDRRQAATLQNLGTLPSDDAVKLRLSQPINRGAMRNNAGSAGEIRRVQDSVNRLQIKRHMHATISAAELDEVIEELAETLSRVSIRRNERLNQLHYSFVQQIVRYATDRVAEEDARTTRRRKEEFAEAELKPTRLGNRAAALRSYCQDHYGIDFEWFWPRFLLAIRKDDKLSAVIATAKIQLDFAVLCYALSVVSVGLWVGIGLFAWRDGSYLHLFLALAAAPPVIAMFLKAVHVSYAEFADTVRAAIDNGRFELLNALRIPLPGSLEKEREIWTWLAQLMVFGSGNLDLTLKHPAG